MKRTLSVLLTLLMVLSIAAPLSVLSSAASYVPTAKAVSAGSYAVKQMVKTVESIGEETVSDTYTYNYTYDSVGRLTKVTMVGPGYSSYKLELSYSNGNCIKEVSEEKDGSSCNKSTITRTFNSSKQLTKSVEKTTFNYTGETATTSTTTHTYSYTSAGKVAKHTESYTDADSKYTDSYTYTYDSSNRLTKSVNDFKYNGSASSPSTTTYTYNSKGLMTKAVTTRKYDTTPYTFTYNYTYNSANLIASGNCYIKAGTSKAALSGSYKYTYDKNNNCTKYSNGDYTVAYTYDSSNRLISEKCGADYNNYEEKITYASNGTVSKRVRTDKDEEGTLYKRVTYTYTYTKINATQYRDKNLVYTVINETKTTKPQVIVYGMKDSEEYPHDFYVSGAEYEVTYKAANGKNTIKVEFLGNASFDSVTFTTKAPLQVNGLKVSKVATTSISLSWTKATGAKYYKVEQSTDGKTWKTVKTASTNSATISSLKAGTKYQYKVTCLDSSKKVLGIASSVLKTGTLTSAPSLTLAAKSSKTATATWKKVTGAAKYTIYKSTDNKKWTKVTTTTSTSYTLKSLSGGKKIYVKVTAINAYGKASAASAVKSVTVKK